MLNSTFPIILHKYREAGSLALLLIACLIPVYGQGPEANMTTIYPQVSQEVLTNPGIGFTTFQRFNGDELNDGIGWTEGYPIEYQPFDGDLVNKDYPNTTIAYFRVNWRFVEEAPGEYNWHLLDRALSTAGERGQTLMIRISPYEGDPSKDVPDWYRQLVGEETNLKSEKWNVNPENPHYLEYFGGLIAAMGKRYDGHPYLEAVDVSFIGYWGEGDGTHLLSDKTRIALINCYLDNFKNTHLIFQPLNGDAPDPGVLVSGTKVAASWPDGTNNGAGTDMRHLGWRIDCLGDMSFFPQWGFSHMLDVYPQDIVKSGMSEAWKKAPIAMEICGTFLNWKEKQQYSKETVKYIFDQALKWHVSSFNAKSSAVPEEWKPLVDDWLKKMGYRFALRKISYSSASSVNGQIFIESWWENQGVAPVYRDYKLAFRLNSEASRTILITNADIKTWMPGDILFDQRLYIPKDLPAGDYQLEVALVDPVNHQPKINLANKGTSDDRWLPLGDITVSSNRDN